MSGRGGKRTGAGRKAGVPNKASQARQREVAASGVTPLNYMLEVMRNPQAPTKRRDEMAKAAANYVHPKLESVKLGGSVDVNFVDRLKRARERTRRPAA